MPSAGRDVACAGQRGWGAASAGIGVVSAIGCAWVEAGAGAVACASCAVGLCSLDQPIAAITTASVARLAIQGVAALDGVEKSSMSASICSLLGRLKPKCTRKQGVNPLIRGGLGIPIGAERDRCTGTARWGATT